MPAASVKTILSRMRQLEIRTRRLVNDSLIGEYHSVFKGRGMDFDEVREYVPGDEVRSIDWNVTARAGRPFVKKYTEERELNILLVVDISASGNFGSGAQSKRDLAGEVASLLALSAIRNSDKVGLLLYTDRVEEYIPPKKGRRHVLRVVREILYHAARRPGHGHDQGARGRWPAPAPAGGGVFDIRFPDERTRIQDQAAVAQGSQADQSAARSRRRAHRGSARAHPSRFGRVGARGRGVRRSDRDRYGECGDPASLQRGGVEARAAADLRHPLGGRRYLGAQHGCALSASLATLLQGA